MYYGSATPTSLSRLVIMQKKAIRTICNVPSRTHTAPLFKTLQILPVDKLIHFSKIKFMHNYVHNRLPFSFNETWVKNIERNPTCKRHASEYAVIRQFNPLPGLDHAHQDTFSKAPTQLEDRDNFKSNKHFGHREVYTNSGSKGQSHEILCSQFFPQTAPPGPIRDVLGLF